VKHDSPDRLLFDECFRILKETEEVLARAHDVLRGLADGVRHLTTDEANGIANALEQCRQGAARRVQDYQRLQTGRWRH
jgi:hypothetical protein